jgi:hypothetical protein
LGLNGEEGEDRVDEHQSEGNGDGKQDLSGIRRPVFPNGPYVFSTRSSANAVWSGRRFEGDELSPRDPNRDGVRRGGFVPGQNAILGQAPMRLSRNGADVISNEA